MSKQRPGGKRNGKVSVRIVIDPETRRTTAIPARAVVHEGERVIWTFDNVPESHRPQLLLVNFRRKLTDKLSRPRPVFGGFKTSRSRVESDGCRSGFEGLHAYDVWLMPLAAGSQAEQIKEDPDPPDAGSPERLVAGSQPEQIQEDPDPPDWSGLAEIKVESRQRQR